MLAGAAAWCSASSSTLHGRPAGLTSVGEHQASTTKALGSSTGSGCPSTGKGREGGEHISHVSEAGPADRVCARSSGGGRDGGDRNGDDALISFETLQTGSNDPDPKRINLIKPKKGRCDYTFPKSIRWYFFWIRTDSEKEMKKGGHLPGATSYRRRVSLRNRIEPLLLTEYRTKCRF